MSGSPFEMPGSSLKRAMHLSTSSRLGLIVGRVIYVLLCGGPLSRPTDHAGGAGADAHARSRLRATRSKFCSNGQPIPSLDLWCPGVSSQDLVFGGAGTPSHGA